MRQANSMHAQCARVQMTFPGWQVAHTSRPLTERYTTIPAGFYAVHSERVGEPPIVAESLDALTLLLLQHIGQLRERERWAARSDLQRCLPVPRRPP